MRYGLYFSPAPSSTLWEIGCKWLGRDAQSLRKYIQPEVAGISPAELFQLTNNPRRYGLHGTLKAPFRMQQTQSVQDLIKAVRIFCLARKTCVTPPLALHVIDNFFCLSPQQPSSQLNTLAADCVHQFMPFQAPATQDELIRRRTAGLSSQEEQNLIRWGYPYVMEQFRFHLTLSNKVVDANKRNLLQSSLMELFAGVLGKPLIIDAISIFVEPAPGDDFYLLGRYPFGQAG